MYSAGRPASFGLVAMVELPSALWQAAQTCEAISWPLAGSALGAAAVVSAAPAGTPAPSSAAANAPPSDAMTFERTAATRMSDLSAKAVILPSHRHRPGCDADPKATPRM